MRLIVLWCMLCGTVPTIHSMDILRNIFNCKKKEKKDLWIITNQRQNPVKVAIYSNNRAYRPHEEVDFVFDDEGILVDDTHDIFVRKNINTEGFFSLDPQEKVTFDLHELPESFELAVKTQIKEAIIFITSRCFEKKENLKNDTAMYPTYIIEEKKYDIVSESPQQPIDLLLKKVQEQTSKK